MKKLLCIFIFIVLSLFIISCKKDDVNNEDDNDNSKIDDDNSEDDNNNYKAIIKYRSIINIDPYEYVYAFYSIDGEKIGASYEDASDFYKGYASVKLKNSREYFLIDENGKRVTSDMYSVETIKGNYDYPYVYKIKNFTEEDYKYRYALGNYKGKVLTEFKYLDIVAKADVYFAYTIDNEYKKCFDVLTKDGKTLLKDIENDLIVTDSFIIYYKNNYDNTDFTIYNKSGTELSKFNVKTKERASNIDIREISNEYLGICIKLKNTVNNLYYVSNLKGEDVMPEYSFISYEKENDILTLNDKNDSSIYKYFNSKLEPYLNDKDIIYYIGNDFLAVKKDDLAYCYNKNSNLLIDKGFNEIYFAKNLIECFLDGEGFIYDLKGNLLFQYPLSINYLFYYDIDNDKLFCYVVQGDNLIFYEVNNGVATKILTTQKAACGIYKSYLVLYSDRNKVYNLLTKELILELEKGYSSSFPVDSFCFFSAAKDNHYIYYNDKFEEILNINVDFN